MSLDPNLVDAIKWPGAAGVLYGVYRILRFVVPYVAERKAQAVVNGGKVADIPASMWKRLTEDAVVAGNGRSTTPILEQQTKILEKLSESFEEHSQSQTRMLTILEERLPRRGETR